MKRLLVGIVLLIVASSASGVINCLNTGNGGVYCSDSYSGRSWQSLKVPNGTVIISYGQDKRKSKLAESLEGWNPRECELSLGCTGEYR